MQKVKLEIWLDNNGFTTDEAMKFLFNVGQRVADDQLEYNVKFVVIDEEFFDDIRDQPNPHLPPAADQVKKIRSDLADVAVESPKGEWV